MKLDHIENIKHVEISNLWAMDFDFNHPRDVLKSNARNAFEVYFSERTPFKKVQAEELIIEAIETLGTYSTERRYSPSRIEPTELIEGILKAKIISEKTALQAMRLLLSNPMETSRIVALKKNKYLLDQFKSNDMFMTAMNQVPLERMPTSEINTFTRHIIMTAIRNGILNQNEVIKLVNDISEQVSREQAYNIEISLLGHQFKINTQDGMYIINSAIANKSYDHKLLIDSISRLITSPTINSFKGGIETTRTYSMMLMECVITGLVAREQEINSSDLLIANHLVSIIEDSNVSKCGVDRLYAESALAFNYKLSIMKINAADKHDSSYEQKISKILRKMKEPLGYGKDISEHVHPIKISPDTEKHLVENTAISFPLKFIPMLTLGSQLRLLESNRIQEDRPQYINLTMKRVLHAKHGSPLLKQLDELCYNELKDQGASGQEIHTLIDLINNIKVNPFSSKTIELAHTIIERDEASGEAIEKTTRQTFLNNINLITRRTAHDAPIDLTSVVKHAIVMHAERNYKGVTHTALYDFGSDEMKDKVSKSHLDKIKSISTPRTSSEVEDAVSFLIYRNPTANGFLEQVHIKELIDSNITKEAGVIIAVRAVLPFLDAGYSAGLKNISEKTALGIINTLAEHAMMSEIEKGHHGTITNFVKKFLATTSINFMDKEHHDFNEWMSLHSGPIYEAVIAEKLQSKLEQQPPIDIHAAKLRML
ncbi:hypothetical protein ACK32R_04575 [Aeromonas dhakensis]|uniref:hypothetical protein n=1 Tax=Aeromonas dhakensis TaxID=196024 RepID=UPI0039877546